MTGTSEAKQRGRVEQLVMGGSAMPRAIEEIVQQLDAGIVADPLLAPVLVQLAASERRNAILSTEVDAQRRLGWRIVRPLFALAVVALPLFVWQKWVDATMGYALFVGGAACCYLVLQVYLQSWITRGERLRERLAEEDSQRLARLLSTHERSVPESIVFSGH